MYTTYLKKLKRLIWHRRLLILIPNYYFIYGFEKALSAEQTQNKNLIKFSQIIPQNPTFNYEKSIRNEKGQKANNNPNDILLYYLLFYGVSCSILKKLILYCSHSYGSRNLTRTNLILKKYFMLKLNTGRDKFKQ